MSAIQAVQQPSVEIATPAASAKLTRATIIPWALAGGLTLLGLVLRLYHLDARSLWFDEIVSAYPVRLRSVGEVITYLGDWTENTPLAFVVTWLLRGLGGGEAAIRLPFAVMGTLNILAIWLLGKTLFGRRLGLIAAMLLALAPFAVYFSQEARPYTYLMLFSTLQALFAYKASSSGRWSDWLGLALSTLLNLYSGYLSLAPTAVVAVFIVIVLSGDMAGAILRRRRDDAGAESARQTRRALCMRVGMAASTAALVFVGYLPWLPSFINFATDPTLNFNRLPRDYHATWADVQTVLDALGITGLWLVLMCVGIIASIAWVRRGTWQPSVLLLLWLVGPLVGFWLRVGDGFLLMETRHFAIFFPVAVLFVALGAESIARLLGHVIGMGVTRLKGKWAVRRPKHTPQTGAQQAGVSWARFPYPFKGQLDYLGMAFTAILLLLLAQTIPALVASYGWPKRLAYDYRGAAQHIMAQSPRGSLALILGTLQLKPTPKRISEEADGIDYYLWLYHAGIEVEDATRVDNNQVNNVVKANGSVWGVLYAPFQQMDLKPSDTQKAQDMGLELSSGFGVITLVHQKAPAAPQEQLDSILRWATGFQPGLVATRSLFDEQFVQTGLGDNLLPQVGTSITMTHGYDGTSGDEAAEKWVLWSGTSLSPDRQAFVMTPGAGNQPEVNVTLTTHQVHPGPIYVLQYQCQNSKLQGEQRLYVSAYNADGELRDVYPYGDGYQCPQAPDSSAPAQGAFAFQVPATTTKVLIWLRAEGTGTAQYSSVQLRPVR